MDHPGQVYQRHCGEHRQRHTHSRQPRNDQQHRATRTDHQPETGQYGPQGQCTVSRGGATESGRRVVIVGQPPFVVLPGTPTPPVVLLCHTHPPGQRVHWCGSAGVRAVSVGVPPGDCSKTRCGAVDSPAARAGSALVEPLGRVTRRNYPWCWAESNLMHTAAAPADQQTVVCRPPPGRRRRIRYRIRALLSGQIPSTAMNPRAQVIHLGELSVRLRQAARHLFETVLAPLGLFWLMLTLTNLTGGLVAALSWALGVLLCRLFTRSPIPAVLWLTTGLLVIRTAIGYATGSVFLYFLQPTLQNFVIAFVLLATLGLRRPLIARLADDFCAFPVALTSNLRVQRFFRRVSLLWALVFLTNGAATLWVL